MQVVQVKALYKEMGLEGVFKKVRPSHWLTD